MSDSSESSQHCCIVCETNTDDLSTIAEIENAMEITSLSDKFNRNLQPSDTICLLCVDSMETKEDMPYRCETPYSEGMDSSSSSETCSSSEEYSQADNPWNIIIVNHIPLDVDREKLISVFSEYGTIVDTYLCGEVEQDVHKHERIARITFSEEDEAWNAWEAAQRKLIKYDDHVLIITLISDDFSPIQNLPTECLREIFLRVHSVADKFTMERVCKRWNNISRQSWSSVTEVSEYWPSPTWRTIASRAGHSLRDVKLSVRVEQFQNAEASLDDLLRTLNPIAQHCVNLEGLMVSVVPMMQLNMPHTLFNSLYMPYLRLIISKNECLRRLSLYWEYMDEGHESFIASFSPDIEDIRLQALDPSLGFNIRPLGLSKFRNLQVLILSTFRIYDNQLRGIETLENLRVLNLDQSEVHPSNMERLVYFTKLEYLVIPNCGITDEILSKILRNNEGLKYLDISDEDSLITDFSIRYLWHLRNLQVLVMKELTKVINLNLTEMPLLHTLDCSGCVRITDETIQQLFYPDSVISRLYIANCEVTLDTLKNADEWVSKTGKSLKVYIDEALAEQWEDSGFEITSTSSSEIMDGLHVTVYHNYYYHNLLPNRWDNYGTKHYNN